MRTTNVHNAKMNRRGRKGWGSRLLCSAVVIALCVAVISPSAVVRAEEGGDRDSGLGDSKSLNCEFAAHTHGESCNGPSGDRTCGIDTEYILHTHDRYCKDETGQQVCQLDEVKLHTHDASCFGIVVDKDNLICILTEDKGHTHVDACYPLRPDYENLTCNQKAGEAHDHNDACFAMVRGALVCAQEENGEHSHTDECYSWSRGEKNCPLEEATGHTHTDDCYAQVKSAEPDCGEIERSEGHIHEDGCYGTKTIQTCAEEERSPHFHTEDCWDKDGNLICGQRQPQSHQHTESCWKTTLPELTEEERIQVDELRELLKSLPTEKELKEKFDSFEDEDDSARDTYLMELNKRVKEAYAKYEALNDNQKAVLMAEAKEQVALLENLNGILSAMPLEEVQFTVEYYGNQPDYAWNTGGSDLKVLYTRDTTPQNGDNREKFTEYTIGLTDGRLNKEYVDIEIYKEESVIYADDLKRDISRLDKLRENQSYTLQAVQVVTKTGEIVDGTEETTVTATYDIDKVRLTDGETYEEDGITYIGVTNDTILRMLYQANQTGSVDYDASFYDYEINYYDSTDDSSQIVAYRENNGSIATYFQNDHSGINDPANYAADSAESSRLMFGGQTYGVAGSQNNYPGSNQFINKTQGYDPFSGITFGMVTGMDEKGNIQYATGINAPNLFHDGPANGKTTFPQGTLTFEREGDIYTLTTATVVNTKDNNRTSQATGLDVFKKTDKGTTSNNFWPLDEIYNYQNEPVYGGKLENGEYVENTNNKIVDLPYVQGHDPKLGDKSTLNGQQQITNENTTWSTGYSRDSSDNSIAHNSFFGMNFAVDFTLDDDYRGFLDYLFYGDDDMWVFLTDHQNGTTTLVADLGGVHGTYGYYVNLWDYIQKGNCAGEYTLTVFYTERGSYGSTCFIQYILPNATSAPVVPPTEYALTVKKLVDGEGEELTKDFTFTLKLEDPKTGNPLTTGITFEPAGKAALGDNGVYTFKLKHNEVLKVYGIPLGIKYTVNEISSDGYTYTLEGKQSDTPNRNSAVTFINKKTPVGGPVLPLTGGQGTYFFYFSAAILLTGAGMLDIQRRRKEAKL